MTTLERATFDKLFTTVHDLVRDVRDTRTAEPPFVVARAILGTGTAPTLTTAVTTIINYTTIQYDTAGAITTGVAWTFTAPIAGYYNVSAAVQIDLSTAWANGELAQLALFKNGGSHAVLAANNDVNSATVAVFVNLAGATIVQLAARDYIDIRVTQNSGGTRTIYVPSSGNGGDSNHVSIFRV